jgi:hypothetical protein
MLRKVVLDSDTLLSDVGEGGGLRPVHDVTVNLSNRHVFINGNGRILEGGGGETVLYTSIQNG